MLRARDFAPGNGGTWSCSLRELIGDIGWQQVAARRERLAELDEDRSELLERESQALARGVPARTALKPGPRARRRRRSAADGTGASRARNRPARGAPARAESRSAAAVPAIASSRLRPPASCRIRCVSTRQARLDPIELLAQLIDAAQELLGLGARHQIAALVREILRDIRAARCARRLRVRLRGRARKPRVSRCAPLRPIRRDRLVLEVGPQQRARAHGTAARLPHRLRCARRRAGSPPAARRPINASSDSGAPLMLASVLAAALPESVRSCVPVHATVTLQGVALSSTRMRRPSSRLSSTRARPDSSSVRASVKLNARSIRPSVIPAIVRSGSRDAAPRPRP